MKAPWRSPALVAKSPILTTLLMEAANVQQLWRMWTERTAEGQSLTAWVCVWFALLIFLNFYRQTMPPGSARKWAIRSVVVGLVLNALVCATVLYWRIVG